MPSADAEAALEGHAPEASVPDLEPAPDPIDALTLELRAYRDELAQRETDSVQLVTERLKAEQQLTARMQERIESLQRDQARALLGPAVTELANLHAAVAEAARRDYEPLGPERIRKEFDLLADQVERTIDLLGAQTLDARPGDPFDMRQHTAAKQVPTADPALDKTIAAVLRQGFRFDPDSKPALYARVSVFAFDPTLAAHAEDADIPLPLGTDRSEDALK
ncbi:nucleotide exchange factor GrpE [Leifsonia sp. NCR5]|uniref:nucleotide exchange factor GrpE n=1 Tax=Leifsonia sp. NCR5 TaxID=1978342 RepID=UPI0015C416B9|nr:nucleotide exchange factor GrpE [Leifsonia sp. NCR5]